MIGCKYFENIDISSYRGDVFDHPSYQSFCHLKDKNIHRYWCDSCESYVPNYEGLSDYDLIYELRRVTERLQTDDRVDPMPWSLVGKLIDRKKNLIQEANKRNLTIK
jgi:hypothetical protein